MPVRCWRQMPSRLAHFVEHMAFNGTQRFDRQELVNNVERMGMRFGPHLNAYTSFDETVYQLQVPTDSARLLETAVTILEQWARGMAFDTVEVRKERGVVVEEWRLGQGAETRMQRREIPVIFRGSQYAERLPIGKKEILESFDPVQLRAFYNAWYRPDLMAVVAVGDFDPARMVELIRDRFSAIPAVASPRPRTVYPVPDHDSTFIVVSTDPEATSSEVLVYYKQPARQMITLRDYRRALVEHLYNRMLNERLSEMTRRPGSPFIQAFSGQGSIVRTKEVYVLGAVVENGGIARGLEAVLTEAERVDRFGFTASELERAKSNLMRGIERAFNERDKSNSSQFVAEYVNHFLQDEPFPGIEAEFAITKWFLPQIGLEEVNGLAREWITDRNRVIVARSPEKEGVTAPSEEELASVFARARRANVAAYVDSSASAPLFGERPSPARIVSQKRDTVLGTFEWKFANGLRVIAKPTDFKADEILFTGYSPGGSSRAPDRDYFNASAAATLVQLGGLGQFNQTELRKKLAGVAVAMGPYIARDQEGFRGSAAPGDLETALQLVHLAAVSPRADTSAYTAFISNLRGVLANRGASPEAAFEDTVTVTLTQHHPLTRPLTVERLSELDLQVALRIYRDRFADMGDFTFVFVGNLDVDSLRTMTASYLGTLPSSGRKETWRDLGIRQPTGVVERVVTKGLEPRARTQIVFNGPFEYTPQNRYLLQSLAEVLSISLRERLREELGATYGVSVTASTSRIPRGEYGFTIDYGSSPERAEELSRVIFAYLDTVRASGADTSAVSKVRESHLRSRETSLRQNGYWLSQIAFHDQTGEDPLAILTIRPMVDRLSSRSMGEAARRWLLPRRYVKVTLLPERAAIVK
jgi:zinc protease